MATTTAQAPVQQAPAKTASWNALKPVEKKNNLKMVLEKYMPNFDLLLRGQIDPRVLIFAVINSAKKNPDILNCTRESILRSVIHLAQIGLLPDTPDDHAYLIPFKKECVVIIGYQGYIELAHRSGKIAKIWAEPVYEGDEFEEVLGAEPSLTHKPKIDSKKREVICAYAVAKYLNGEVQWVNISRDKLDKIRSQSKGKNSPAYTVWPVEMMIKAPVRALKKYIPTTPAMSIAVALDNAAAMGESQAEAVPIPIDFELVDEETPATPTKSDEMADKLKGKTEAANNSRVKRQPQAEAKEEPPAEPEPDPKPDDESKPEPGTESETEPESESETSAEEDRKQLEYELLDLVTTHEKVLEDVVKFYKPKLIQRWDAAGLRYGIDTIRKILVKRGALPAPPETKEEAEGPPRLNLETGELATDGQESESENGG